MIIVPNNIIPNKQKDNHMKKKYISPSTFWVFVKTEALLGASGGVDNTSIGNEGEENMGSRGFSFDDDDMY